MRSELELRRGGAYQAITTEEMREAGRTRGFHVPEIGMDGEVIESDPPRKLVQTFRMLMDPDVAAEGFTRLTYEIAESQPGVTKLTVIHDLEGTPRLAVLVGGQLDAEGAGGGWAWVLSDLKSLLETGQGFSD
ncbi:MAG: SRPBCC domain-containing protein [Candidatus Dormibacteraceae bacterium]